MNRKMHFLASVNARKRRRHEELWYSLASNGRKEVMNIRLRQSRKQETFDGREGTLAWLRRHQ